MKKLKHGIAFGENIKTEKIVRHRGGSSERDFSFRNFLLPVILAASFILLFMKLFSLQIFYGSFYRKLADSNRIRTKIIHAPRGIIFDRNGIPLVFNTPGFRETINGKPVLLDTDHALKKIAEGDKNIEIDSLRQYPLKDAEAHVIGYVGQITKDELSLAQYAGYQGNDLIGEIGIEHQYEGDLRGIDGKQLVEIDAMGKPVRTLGQTDPIPGHDITLTIDSKLQKATYDAAKDIKKGAVVVSTPKGEILSIVSKPSFDPNLFTISVAKAATDSAYQHVSDILTDAENNPLLDRAISGVYPPGSTFKILSAATALDEHIIDSSWAIQDTGVLKVGTFSFANWYFTDYGRTEQGPVDVKRAITRSNDIFFYKLAEKIGVDKLSQGVLKFGLGKKLGIDLGGEAHGTVPTTEWKQQTIGEQWYLGDTYNFGIGQGYLLTTPLQVNTWTQVMANGGTLYGPHLLKSKGDQVIRKNVVGSSALDLIRQGMIGACDPGGVAWPLFNFTVKNPHLPIDGRNITAVVQASGSAALKDSQDYRHITIACKTGTAEFGGKDTKPHAWITLFAPAYDPQIVVTVLNESSGEGSNEAAPVAKKILEAYFGNQ